MNIILGSLMILTFILLVPLIGLASLNTLAEQANLGWYIPHNGWTYLSVYGILAITHSNSTVGVKQV